MVKILAITMGLQELFKSKNKIIFATKQYVGGKEDEENTDETSWPLAIVMSTQELIIFIINSYYSVHSLNMFENFH